MTSDVLFSEDTAPADWSETTALALQFGPKGATLAALPRAWTPPFVLVSASKFDVSDDRTRVLSKFGEGILSRIRTLADLTGRMYVRSSVIGETIWERGSYKSIIIDLSTATFEAAFASAIWTVIDSAPGRQVSLVLQSHVRVSAQGEFGNLLRVSKTRDHWELSSEAGGTTSRVRLNTQRDESANPNLQIDIKSGIARERIFGSVAAWLNSYLLRGYSQRVNCEWIADNSRLYLVQIDEESEDFLGVNPFQLRIATVHQPKSAKGFFLRYAENGALADWDKLSVLNELWEPDAAHKPILFYVPLADLPHSTDSVSVEELVSDFRDLIGHDNIVVRTSVRGGAEKLSNLSRTEGLNPAAATAWCLQKRDEFLQQAGKVDHLAFVAHRFMAARASAWVRAEPGNPMVEIHSLWGLPDTLQFCPYDIWEVHLPTDTATEYSDYKSHMLISREDGDWEYVRVKNEFGRSLSIGRREAVEIATRTAAIVERLAKPCHVMWFVGCVDTGGCQFSIPWYWTPAHDTEKNLDRSNYQVSLIANQADLLAFKGLPGPMIRRAIELAPKDLEQMRDMAFIGSVGDTARELRVHPIKSQGALVSSSPMDCVRAAGPSA